jgi:hypothetical protein
LFGTFFCPYIGNVIIPTDELIFFKGVETTNQGCNVPELSWDLCLGFFKGMCICFFPISLYGIIYGFIWGFMIIYDDLCLGFTSGWVYVWDIFSDSRENPSNNSSMD